LEGSKEEMSEKSETFIARLRYGSLRNKGVRSFRITIPIEIVRVMGLKYGDYLRVTIKKIVLKEAEE